MVCVKFVVVAALSSLALAAPQDQSNKYGDWRSKIKNVVVLVEENRSFDTFAGGLTYDPSIDGLLHHNYCNSMNASDPSQHDDVCAGPRANDVAPDDPNHSISGVNMQLFSTWHPDEVQVDKFHEAENMRGFVTEQSVTYKTLNKTRAAEAINYYTPDQIPFFNTIAENFVLFDRWFASVPGPTNPNRAYLTSGTSAGHGKNDAAFDVYGLPQRSVFQQLSENNITWMNYQNSTTGPGLGFNPDAAFYSWTETSGAKDTNIAPLDKFYADAKAGTLPQFTYINPECCSYQSFHPPSPITLGEQFIKGIYEAVRNSPQWEETLFILTFDEHGGFGDHVPPPVNVPAGDNLTYTELAPDGRNNTFDFKRLGLRVPTLLISPWVGKGIIEKKGLNNGGEYTHTSILKFINELWALDDLTERVTYSSTFEHLITDIKRDDTPAIL
ncbi:Non-specific phospholipase C6 [Lachnellula hyalina]|uniref:Non-specific phospholipase C6 n=1 Tax=Lachnellula hyalina TaxID=1316788 RepID=A0A8H8R544_9HELO|nr:Non-specific phospholipase C6 [Lachnellula hyalina]TVY28523.1 Non-specific phospholipase C6 [Lachnellula hyalina]